MLARTLTLSTPGALTVCARIGAASKMGMAKPRRTVLATLLRRERIRCSLPYYGGFVTWVMPILYDFEADS
jgi:hypothetical protein